MCLRNARFTPAKFLPVMWVDTNTVEVFSIFKRGITGIYQHCESKHLHRYLAEFDFRCNNRIALEINDHQRAENLLAGVVGSW